MPRECTWITAWEEVCSERGSGIPDIYVLAANAFDYPLASEEVVWTFFLRVGVRIGLLGVTVESIFRGEIGTRHWMDKQGAAAVFAAEECREGTLNHCYRHAETRREYWTVGLGPIVANCLKSGLLDIPPYHFISIMNRQLTFADRASSTTKIVPIDDRGHIVTIYGEFVDVFSNEAETLVAHWSIDHAMDLEPGYNLPYGWISIEQS
jgi:hypothetical protein